MKVKNGDILGIKPILEEVLRLPADKLSTRGKYFMAKLGRKLSGPLADIEAARVKLVQEHGEKTETGFAVKEGEPTKAFQAAFAEVLDIEAEMDWSVCNLNDKDAEALTGGQMFALDKFFAFPDPDAATAGPHDGAVKEAEAVVAKK